MTRLGLALVLAASCVAAYAVEKLAISAETRTVAEQAEKFMRECRYDDADALVTARMNTAPAADRSLLLLTAGMLAEHRGDPKKALQLYEEVSAGDRVPLQALRLLGRARIANRQFAEGEQSLMAYVNHQLQVVGQLPAAEDFTAVAVAVAEGGRPQEALKLLDLVMERVSTYHPLVISLRAKLQAAKGGGAEPGSYWAHAYGGEQSLGMVTDDFAPQPLKRVPPMYPRQAARDGVGGRVILRVKIDASGKTTDAWILSSKPRRVFDDVARSAVRQWTYVPRVRNCRPIATEAIQQIDFRMAN